MQNQIIETVARGLLTDFMTTNDLEPVLDSLDVQYSGPHMIIEMAGKSASAIEYRQVIKGIESFLKKHNSISKIQFSLYTVTFYDDIYISIAQ